MKKRQNAISYWIMVMPALVWLVLVNIVPMGGVVMAFQDFNPGKGIFRSPWVGLENFQYMLQLKDVQTILINTFTIAVFQILGNLIVPVVFALLLNEISHAMFKRVSQTLVYIPHFLSWVALSGMLMEIFGHSGPINAILTGLGFDRLPFFQDGGLFRGLIIGSDIWKEFGFKTVIYLAALTGVSPSLYEAAAIDGANRWQRIDKFAVKRTMSSAVDSIMDYMKKAGVGSRHILYIAHARALEDAKKIQEMMERTFEGLEIHILELSPVFVAQGGPKCVAIQYIERF